MFTRFPQAVPEIPVSNVEKAAEYYANVLGFRLDWGNDQGGIGGISQGACRMFLTNASFRQNYATGGPVMIWLNLESKEEVDELYRRWQQAGANIVSQPEDKPWHCASSESPTSTTTNCVCFTTSPGNFGYLAETRLHDDKLAAACRSRLTQGYARLDPALPSKKLVTSWRLWLPSATKQAAK